MPGVLELARQRLKRSPRPTTLPQLPPGPSDNLSSSVGQRFALSRIVENVVTILMARVPAARGDNLVSTETVDDLLIYDQATQELHRLNRIAASVWRHCDGTRTVGDIMLATGLSDEAVLDVTRLLSDASLLEGTFPGSKRGTRSSRRRIMKQAAVAVPLVVSISAPMAADAKSDTCLQPCSKPSECRGECATCKQYSPSNAARICCNSKQGTGDYCFSK